VQTPPKDKSAADAFAGKPVANTLWDHIGVQLGTWPKLFVALLVYSYYFPSIEACKVLSQDWIKMILVRDLVITYLTAGFWDSMMYFVFREQMRGFKFNPRYPQASQFVHDVFWSTCSTIISSAVEVWILHWYAIGKFSFYTLPEGVQWFQDTATLLWLLSMPYWRLAHFYTIHRGMHPWYTTSIPDVGQFLYKWVHSLHHKSKNPTSWSGVSMHPIESSTYYTAMLIPVLFGAHPLVFLYTKFDLTMAALIGHDGFGAQPGNGSQTHWLHHNNFDCNYGEVSPFFFFFLRCVSNPVTLVFLRLSPLIFAELRAL
jgi:sterol desaturase/sphingolipid hydroxylase (fatty acid hydroxylase superfamily)